MKNEIINQEIEKSNSSENLNDKKMGSNSDNISGDSDQNMTELELWEKKNFYIDDYTIEKSNNIQSINIQNIEKDIENTKYLRKKRSIKRLDLNQKDGSTTSDNKQLKNQKLIYLFEDKISGIKNQVIVKWLSNINLKYENLSKIALY